MDNTLQLLSVLLRAAVQADCDIVVTLCLRMIKDIGDKLHWLAEPLPGVRDSAAASGAGGGWNQCW